MIITVESHGDADGRIDSIFWTTEFRTNPRKDNSKVLDYDTTFRTNQHDMPLVQLTGTIYLHTNHSLRWAAVGGLSEEFHYWALHDCVLYLSLKYKISLPFFTVRDRDLAYKNTCAKQRYSTN